MAGNGIQAGLRDGRSRLRGGHDSQSRTRKGNTVIGTAGKPTARLKSTGRKEWDRWPNTPGSGTAAKHCGETSAAAACLGLKSPSLPHRSRPAGCPGTMAPLPRQQHVEPPEA